jgi:hypothetical protein
VIARSGTRLKGNGVVSYRSRVFNHDREFEPRSRTRLLAIVGAVAVVGGVGGALLIPNLGSVFGASNAASVAGACATPSAASTAVGTTAAAAAPAAAATPSSTAAAVAPTPSGTVATPVASAPAAAAAPAAATAATAAATAPAAAATTGATAPATAGAATTGATAAATPTICPTASAAATATATAPAAAAANVSCSIVVPANPLTAQGLATPYQLTGANGMTPQASGCTMANFGNLGAFVQATILDPATGKLSVYEPLVITQGTTPAAAPVVPTLPAGAVVTIDFGFNGTNLTQVGATPTALAQGNCVNGTGGSIFGQVSFCNGTAFFQAAQRAEAAGTLVIPATGTSTKVAGLACPTTRSFTMIDQDQSDNVTTQYLLDGNGLTAQNTPANKAAMANSTVINNGSDNALLNGFLYPTLGCTPFTAPDLTNGGTPGTSQAMDELSAAKNQQAPIALVPENDEMTLVNNAFSVTKTNLYRSNVGQAPVSAANDMTSSPANYCQNMVNLQTSFLQNNQALLATGTSPVPGVGNNLLTFLANRMNMSFTNLNCQNFGLKNPVTVTLDGNGVATAATFNVTQQQATGGTPAGAGAPGTTMPPTRHRIGRNHRHHLMNPSGM